MKRKRHSSRSRRLKEPPGRSKKRAKVMRVLKNQISMKQLSKRIGMTRILQSKSHQRSLTISITTLTLRSKKRIKSDQLIIIKLGQFIKNIKSL